MHKVSELVGKSIVSAATGERLGTVSDVLVDQQSHRVLGFVIGGGLMSSEHVLPHADVQAMGADAVVARSATGMVGAKEWRERGVAAARTSTLKHRRVLTTGGRALGEVHDVLLDDRGAAVAAFDVSAPSLGGLMHKHAILPYVTGMTIGADAVLVPDESVGAWESPDRPS